jgi:hypothetical protein
MSALLTLAWYCNIAARISRDASCPSGNMTLLARIFHQTALASMKLAKSRGYREMVAILEKAAAN